MTTERNDAFALSFDTATGIATFELAMAGGVNKVDETLARGLGAAIDWATGREGLAGILLTSAHETFCVGADIDALFTLRDPAATDAYVAALGAVFRRLETLDLPVACALTGTALGGGYELALACHHRVALDSERVQLGLPEVGLGVIPGAGGTQRLPRLIGIREAIDHITRGQPVRPAKAHALGMVDALAPDPGAVVEAARRWLLARPKGKQPWDQRGFTWPGPGPGTQDARNIFMGASARIFKKTAGTMPQVEAALSAIQEGAAIAFDRALEVERRYFVRCAVSDQSKDMIRTSWYHRNAAMRAEGLPVADDHGFAKVGIVGAGMMGAGLAFIAAAKGFEVVLKDIDEAQLEAARAHVAAQVKRRRHLSADAQRATLDRVRFTLDDADLGGVDLVIEAVVESDAVKQAVTRQVEPLLAEGGVFASNTSAIPITHLAKASARPAAFVGLHFFSPVEKMPLVEIIAGEATSEATLARAVRFGLALGKLPIVVNDGYGFYTSRVFITYLMEAVQLVTEGHDPVLIEWAARQAGMVVSPLKVYDEVTLRLGHKATLQRQRYLGEDLSDVPAVKLLTRMVDLGRVGRIAGKGFYDYEGRSSRLWPGLAELVGEVTPAKTGVDYLADRLMLVQVREVALCLQQGVLRSKRDAEVGAVFGIGFSPASGGPLSWLDRRGICQVVTALEGLQAELGDRWAPPRLLVDMARRRERFFPEGVR
ncbi:MAG: 3-hydroxyacyl-CoA dehydrogenase [Proteobacteria bacterium]|nr:MAG: 3-hydroxyacyl-CoA dehydrogenase [Pseudomonadota bacterium]